MMLLFTITMPVTYHVNHEEWDQARPYDAEPHTFKLGVLLPLAKDVLVGCKDAYDVDK